MVSFGGIVGTKENNDSYSNQSIANILLTSSVGRPSAVSTITMVTIPA